MSPIYFKLCLVLPSLEGFSSDAHLWNICVCDFKKCHSAGNKNLQKRSVFLIYY